ncbi:hypothetical protein J3492_04020 [Psychrobacter sp. F1192]|uniref:Uncharacterized protein n=1 Tax=Psychrobacter coccoides TaxID=2818440 RepID=A0ABS3NLU1_9GAMM|nr:hypothetical protein [Psychrobacter coccoides]MBO1530379.1 hypothetical protein [Psychrobacter coccoides]
MSNNTSNNQNTKNQHTEKENDAVTAVEVVKDDTVVYEDGDFDDYNADHNYETDADDDSSKEDKSKKNGTSNKDDKSEENNQSEQKKDEEADKKDKSEEDDSSGMTLAGMFQWASKLREDFISEATGMTNGVTEKAAAMTLQRLIAVVDMELAAFDKSVEAAKKLIVTAEQERAKIASRKEKYQDMIDKLDQE